jgi:hypothetical protein
MLMNAICRTNSRWAQVPACLAALVVATVARAQEAKQRLLAEYVPPSLLAESSASTNSSAGIGMADAMDGELANRTMQEPKRELTRGERWEKFEADFGIGKRDPSLLKGSIESAKYRLDRTVFALNEFVQGMEDAFSFDYELRTLRRGAGTNEPTRAASSSAIPLWNAVENARLKSDIDLDMTGGRAFVGVRLVLPIGD